MTELPTGIHKRRSSYYVQWKQDGKWRHRSAGKRLADAIELLDLLRHGREYPADAVRFQDIVDQYLVRQRIYSKPKSVKNAMHSASRLLEHFGDRAVESLGPEDLDRFVQARMATVKPKTVNGDLIILRAMLNQALADGKIEKPLFKVKLLRAPRKKVVRILTKRDIRRLLDHAREPYHGIIYVAASTGFRAGEVLHLRWEDVRVDQQQISVTSKDGWTPKSYEERVVFVPEALLDYLDKRRRTSEFAAERDWVFASRHGTSLDISRVSRNVRKAFELAGLYAPGQGTMHLLRHSVASRLLQEKVDLETVRDILGHSLLSTTAAYLHSTSAAKRDAARRLDLA